MAGEESFSSAAAEGGVDVIEEEDSTAVKTDAVVVDVSLVDKIKVMLQDVILLGAPVNVNVR